MTFTLPYIWDYFGRLPGHDCYRPRPAVGQLRVSRQSFGLLAERHAGHRRAPVAADRRNRPRRHDARVTAQLDAYCAMACGLSQSPECRDSRRAGADLLAVLVAHQGCDAARDKIDDENGIVAEHNRGLSHTGIRAKATPVIGRSSHSRAGCFWRWCGGTGLPSSPADICTKREISPLRARVISGRRHRAF